MGGGTEISWQEKTSCNSCTTRPPNDSQAISKSFNHLPLTHTLAETKSLSLSFPLSYGDLKTAIEVYGNAYFLDYLFKLMENRSDRYSMTENYVKSQYQT